MGTDDLGDKAPKASSNGPVRGKGALGRNQTGPNDLSHPQSRAGDVLRVPSIEKTASYVGTWLVACSRDPNSVPDPLRKPTALFQREQPPSLPAPSLISPEKVQRSSSLTTLSSWSLECSERKDLESQVF